MLAIGLSANAQTKKKYCNSRFDYCIKYPNELVGLGESANGDGQKFIKNNKKISLTVYHDSRLVIYNDTEKAIQGSFKQDCELKDEKTVTYRKLGNSFYVVSGMKGNLIYYQKTIIINSRMITAYLEYDKTLAYIYNDYCKYLFQSFY